MNMAVLSAGAAGALAALALAALWELAGGSSRDALARPERDAAHRRAWPPARRPRAARWQRGLPSRAPLTIAVAVVGWALMGTIGAGLGVVVAVAASRRAAGASRARARRARERGVGALARCLADAIRGGRSIRAALEGAAADRSIAPPLRATLIGLAARLGRGTPLGTALAELRSAGGAQLTLLAAVVALHAERGGPLARELDRLADDADRAVRVDEERAAATAQARATVRTVAALPLLALGGAQLLGGDFLGSVTQHPAALALLITGLALEALAVLIARRLVARAA